MATKFNKEPKTKAIAFSEFEEIMEGVSVETIKDFSDFEGETKQEYMDEMHEWWESATDKERKETIASVKIQFGAVKIAKKSKKTGINIVERSHDKESDDIMEYKFSNGAWVKIDLSDSDNCCYEYQSDEDDEETYMSGCLEFENKVLVGYDGCFELPKEVVEAVKDLGHKIDI